MTEIFQEYLSLRKEIGSHSKNLAKTHIKHMECKAGCDMCCMDYSVFPIEFYYILKQLKQTQKTIQINSNAKDEDCIFLIKHKCTIYQHRPIICRTHGLPLLYANDSGDWELSACELNFTDFEMDKFTQENTFPQDTFNSKLFLLNKKFIEDFKEIKYDAFDLIPIKKLRDFITIKS